MDGEIERVISEITTSQWVLFWTAIAALGALGSATGSFFAARSSAKMTTRMLVETMHQDMLRSLQAWMHRVRIAKKSTIGRLEYDDLNEYLRLLYLQIRIADLKAEIGDTGKAELEADIGATIFDRALIVRRFDFFKRNARSRKVRQALERTRGLYQKDLNSLAKRHDGSPNEDLIAIPIAGMADP